MVAGHSLGGQAVQRYAAIAKGRPQESRIHYWVGEFDYSTTLPGLRNACLLKSLGNPGSILWLVEDRPYPEIAARCYGFDRFKFGLSGGFPAYNLQSVAAMGRNGIVDRYRARHIHHLWGLVYIALNQWKTSPRTRLGTADINRRLTRKLGRLWTWRYPLPG